MKLLAKELGVPILALAQLNRGPEMRTNKKPQVSDLRESGSIEQDADLVMLIHREDESLRAGEVDLIVGKHRNGPGATSPSPASCTTPSMPERSCKSVMWKSGPGLGLGSLGQADRTSHGRQRRSGRICCRRRARSSSGCSTTLTLWGGPAR
ncbi:DnaB-like helicase C-terminal domain-containing protein [Streptomyces sp. NPDC017943]|uniref:DnaB-like helicase C-terminal domain-containing protein n=1 Tax=Streptomyces sp. NPDC017943 TaxID=3365019 RepID=UPI003797FDA1